MSNLSWRPIHFFLLILGGLFLLNVALFSVSLKRQGYLQSKAAVFATVTSGLGLTDLCVSTEARYTRHPAVSDSIVPFMDHPGAIEHFPSGSFWIPPQLHEKQRGT